MKKKYNKFKNLDKILKTIHSLIIIGSTSTSASLLSITGFGLIAVAIKCGVGCGDVISTKLAGEFLKKREKFFPEKYILANNTVQDYKKVDQKSLEEDIIDQCEYKKLVDMCKQYNISTNENKNTYNTKRRSFLVKNFK